MATDAITKLIDVSERAAKELANFEQATVSPYLDFFSRILWRTSSIGFSAMIGVGQFALGPQRNLVHEPRDETC